MSAGAEAWADRTAFVDQVLPRSGELWMTMFPA